MSSVDDMMDRLCTEQLRMTFSESEDRCGDVDNLCAFESLATTSGRLDEVKLKHKCGYMTVSIWRLGQCFPKVVRVKAQIREDFLRGKCLGEMVNIKLWSQAEFLCLIFTFLFRW